MSEPKLIPETFVAQSNAIASYNWTDISDGTGIVVFYGYQEKDSSGTSYKLNQNALYSRAIELTGNAGPDWTKALDLDFDLSSFRTQKDIGGHATFQIPAFTTDSAAAGEAHCYVIVKVRKWDGSTETDIVSFQTDTIDADGGATYAIFTVGGTIPKTHFKRGDTLRITLEVWGSRTNYASTIPVGIAFDPINREGPTYFTAANIDTRVFKCLIPFSIEGVA